MDIKQAFCQSYLPPEEKYVCIPPPGYPLTPPNTYWLLKRTLYGLKRSPRHWYLRAKQILETIGFRQCTHSQCLFVDNLIKGKPPIYVGLYVDDIAYYSTTSSQKSQNTSPKSISWALFHISSD